MNNISISPSESLDLSIKDSEVRETTITVGEADPAGYPEGGKGWLVILGCTFISFTTFGMINAYGVFQSYYETVLFPDVESFKLSLIGALQPSICYLLVPFVIPMYHAFGLRTMLSTGGLLIILSLLVLSTTNQGELWKCYLFQGIIFSVGAAMLFPAVPFASVEWFKLKRASAIGISSCGVGVGGAVWPLVFKHMINKVGFKWTVRTICFIVIPLVALSVLLVPQQLPEEFVHEKETISNAKLDWNKVKNLPKEYYNIFKSWLVITQSRTLVVLLVANFLGMIGSYPAIFYLDLFATTIGPLNKITPFIVMLFSIMGVPGRIIPAIIADRIGRINALLGCLILSGVVIFCMWVPAVKDQNMALFCVFCVVFGFFVAPLFSLFPACLGQMFGAEGATDRLGLFFFTSTPGPILGCIIAGSFIPVNTQNDKNEVLGSFIKLTIFSGITLFSCGLLLLGLRLKVSRKLSAFI